MHIQTNLIFAEPADPSRAYAASIVVDIAP